jgi:Protein of unknown function (DUF3570)
VALASAGAVVAVTDDQDASALVQLLRAAAQLPILIAPWAATTGAAVETPTVSLTVLYYTEPGRMTVKEPVITFAAPMGEHWKVSAHATVDIMSGASPRFVSNETGRPVQTLSSASILDRRTAGDIKVSRRWGDMTLGVSRAESHEDDYHSRATGLEWSWDFNQRTTTLVAGMGRSNDRVGSAENVDLLERRDTSEWALGLTQIVSPTWLIQAQLQRTRGRGFFNDPYKYTLSYYPGFTFPARLSDTRPSSRDSTVMTLRTRWHDAPRATTYKADYRYFRDSWSVRAHTVELGASKDLGERWRLEGSLRYHTQSAAQFYGGIAPLDPSSSGRFPRALPGPFSSDQRLAAWGSLTPMLRLVYQPALQSRFDIGVGTMTQKASLRLGGSGSDSIETFRARMLTVQWTHEW